MERDAPPAFDNRETLPRPGARRAWLAGQAPLEEDPRRPYPSRDRADFRRTVLMRRRRALRMKPALARRRGTGYLPHATAT